MWGCVGVCGVGWVPSWVGVGVFIIMWAEYASSHLVFLLQSLNDVILNLHIFGVLFIQHLPSQHIILGQYWSHAGYLGPVFLILVQEWPKIGRPMFRFMLAGRSFASIPDLGPTVAQDWRPMY